MKRLLLLTVALLALAAPASAHSTKLSVARAHRAAGHFAALDARESHAASFSVDSCARHSRKVVECMTHLVDMPPQPDWENVASYSINYPVRVTLTGKRLQITLPD